MTLNALHLEKLGSNLPSSTRAPSLIQEKGEVGQWPLSSFANADKCDIGSLEQKPAKKKYNWKNEIKNFGVINVASPQNHGLTY